MTGLVGRQELQTVISEIARIRRIWALEQEGEVQTWGNGCSGAKGRGSKTSERRSSGIRLPKVNTVPDTPKSGSFHLSFALSKQDILPFFLIIVLVKRIIRTLTGNTQYWLHMLEIIDVFSLLDHNISAKLWKIWTEIQINENEKYTVYYEVVAAVSVR